MAVLTELRASVAEFFGLDTHGSQTDLVVPNFEIQLGRLTKELGRRYPNSAAIKECVSALGAEMLPEISKVSAALLTGIGNGSGASDYFAKAVDSSLDPTLAFKVHSALLSEFDANSLAKELRASTEYLNVLNFDKRHINLEEIVFLLEKAQSSPQSICYLLRYTSSVAERLSTITYPPANKESVYQAVVLEIWKSSPAAAFHITPMPPRLFTDAAIFETAAARAIEQDGLDFAVRLTALREAELVKNQSTIPFPRGVRDRTRSLMPLVEKVLSGSTISGDNRELLSIEFDLLKRGLIPTDDLARELAAYEPKTRGFLYRMFESCGVVYGRTIFDAIRGAYRSEGELSNNERNVITAIIQSGFRGVSVEVLKIFNDRYQQSPPLAELMMHRWARTARIFLTGNSIPEDIKRDPQYAELIATAYKPGGYYFSMGNLRDCLNSAVDRQEHLAGYKYPKDGYSLSAANVADSRTETGDATAKIHDNLRAAIEALETDSGCDLTATAVKLIQGSDDEVNAAQLISAVLQKYAPKEFETTKENLRGAATPAEKLGILKRLIEHDLDTLFDAYAQDISPQVNLTPKRLNQVRAILKLKEGVNIDTEQVADALRYKLLKLTRVIRNHISRGERETAATPLDDAVLILTKSDHSFFSRGAANLCTVTDVWSWNNPDYLQFNVVARGLGRIVGNVQLNLFTDLEERRSVLPRINVTPEFQKQCGTDAIVDGIIAAVRKFAQDNDLKPYMPQSGNSCMRIASNCEETQSRMMCYHGTKVVIGLQIVANREYDIDAIYEMLPGPKDNL